MLMSQIVPAGARILVVDDTEATRYWTTRVLSAAGAQVIEALDGHSGLELGAGADLILLDINLPDIDGFEVCRRMRARPATLFTPIVHFSATFVAEYNKVKGLQGGADAYLGHPIEPEMLIATINTFLRARRAEESNQKYSQLLKTVFRTAGVGIAVIGPDGSVVEANPTFSVMVQRSHDEIQGMPLAEAMRMQALSMQAVSDVTVITIQRPDGSERTCELHIAETGNGDRVIVVTDITARIALEKEREHLLAAERSARAEAEEANAKKDDFLAVLSHELRNPLGNVLGWSNILKGPIEPKARLDAANAIERNVQVQIQLIEDLLDVSRIAAGKLKIERRRVDARTIVREAVESMTYSAKLRNVTLMLDVGEPVWVNADPTRWQQVCLNLLSNAIKFSNSSDVVRISLKTQRASAHLVVEDQGSGIAPEFLPHIFDRFRQADSSTTRRASGLGLGLAIAHSLVGLHDGEIKAFSEGTGRGARFEVMLPLAASDVGQEALQAPEVSLLAPGPLKGQRVILVEDNAEYLGLLSHALSMWGADVTAFGSAPQALEQVERLAPALLISDISMPGMDGIALVETLRRMGFGSDRVPALALTGFARDSDIERMLRIGFSSHVSKPVALPDLLRAIQLVTASAVA